MWTIAFREEIDRSSMNTWFYGPKFEYSDAYDEDDTEEGAFAVVEGPGMVWSTDDHDRFVWGINMEVLKPGERQIFKKPSAPKPKARVAFLECDPSPSGEMCLRWMDIRYNYDDALIDDLGREKDIDIDDPYASVYQDGRVMSRETVRRENDSKRRKGTVESRSSTNMGTTPFTPPRLSRQM